jgi:putative PIG3 family NAD(P)H quinone oxidoreductase
MPIQAKAVLIQAPGDVQALALGELTVRDPGPHEVLVAVAAAGLNRADILQRKGVYPAPPGAPANVPGLEFAGQVERVGSEVRSFKSGDRVMAIAAGGAMASHIVIHERELLPVPIGMSLTDAAAIPEVFLTAYDAMFLQGNLSIGEHVLIHAIGSGIGTAALQLALATSAVPIGTSRKADKLARCESLGLRHGILTSEGKFADEVKKHSEGKLASVVLDTVGAKYLTENVKAAAARGRIIVIGLLGGTAGELPLGLVVAKRVTVQGSVLRSRSLEEKASLAQRFAQTVLPLFERKVVRPIVEDVMAMREIQKAHSRLESDQTFGKIVLAW